jgi:hypothetical protein
MYVNPFWLGVLVTVAVEIVACIVYAAISEHKKGTRK